MQPTLTARRTTSDTLGVQPSHSHWSTFHTVREHTSKWRQTACCKHAFLSCSPVAFIGQFTIFLVKQDKNKQTNNNELGFTLYHSEDDNIKRWSTDLESELSLEQDMDLPKASSHSDQRLEIPTSKHNTSFLFLFSSWHNLPAARKDWKCLFVSEKEN